jgi:hypothetical protein
MDAGARRRFPVHPQNTSRHSILLARFGEGLTAPSQAHRLRLTLGRRVLGDTRAGSTPSSS